MIGMRSGVARHRAYVGTIAATALTVSLLLVSFGLSDSRPGSSASNGHRNSSRPATKISVSVPAIGLPAGYGSPTSLGPDPTRSGVWFLDASASDVSVFFWNAAARQLERTSLPLVWFGLASILAFFALIPSPIRSNAFLSRHRSTTLRRSRIVHQ